MDAAERGVVHIDDAEALVIALAPLKIVEKAPLEVALSGTPSSTALMLSLTPRWSTRSSCLRRPCGSSLTIEAGMPSRSTALVCQRSAPEQSPAFSSSVSRETRALMSVQSFPFFVSCPPCGGSPAVWEQPP